MSYIKEILIFNKSTDSRKPIPLGDKSPEIPWRTSWKIGKKQDLVPEVPPYLYFIFTFLTLLQAP